MGELLDKIQNPNDIKSINPGDYKLLAREIREFILKNVRNTGGHLASNLGAVELTMVLHLCTDLPKDKIVFDVGHQCYTHKILTGRKDSFSTLRTFEGISGFPRIKESECDVFDTGHSSNSISLALGLVQARELKKEDYKVFTVIGDGALSGGMAFEGLNNAARLKSNLVIVINDNQMSISKNVGGMSNYLGKIRTSSNYTGLKENVENVLEKLPQGEKLTNKIRGAKDVLKRIFIPGMLFEDMGITYIGPIDGHNVSQMVKAFKSALKMNEPVIVHVCTKKGKGFKPAEKNPSKFHGVSSGAYQSGKAKAREQDEIKTYSDVFGEKLVSLAEKNENIVAVTAAMPDGTGLTPFQKRFPKRFFDVGIEEEHAVTSAAGMAKMGIKPYVAIYSTFLQRAYDQIISDVCMQDLPVVLGVDRAGLVGADGKTHQGIYDISFLSSMPNLVVVSPMDKAGLEKAVEAASTFDHPVAIRYPRGEAKNLDREKITGILTEDDDPDVAKALEKKFSENYEFPVEETYEIGKWEYVLKSINSNSDRKIAIIFAGVIGFDVIKSIRKLMEKDVYADVINARYIRPLDEKMLDEISENYDEIFTVEESVISGGFGSAVATYLCDKEVQINTIALPDKFIEHGSVSQLKEKYGLSAEGIAKRVLDAE